MQPNAVTLRKLSHADVKVLSEKTKMSETETRQMLADSDAGTHDGRFFEAYAVAEGSRTVGVVTLYEQSVGVISVGPEVFAEHRRRGIGTNAVQQAIGIAREKGYGIVSQQIRTDNAASIKLHEKCGFETDGRVTRTRKGNDAFLYVKKI